ncbi:MAG TPA: ABC transporter substrate-binding protein [Candidatus Limnocylindrales bacterium]|nr:ABC transporter substrate-binding protein [Candidatus Limnocylindrales bacterium]
MFQRKLGGVIAVAALAAAACGPGTASTAPTTGPASAGPTTAATTAPASAGPTTAAVDVIDSIGAGEGELNLIVWPGYAESGANVKSYDWVHPFQTKTGCQVKTIKEAGSSDEMVQLVNSGGYDGLSASGDASVRLIKDGKIAGVDVEKLFPEWKNFWGPMQSPVHNTIDGVHYGLSHGWGANLLMWNTSKIPTAPTSWSAVFETDPLPAYAGKVTAYNYAIYIADAALYLSKKDASLGITDPYELTQPQFDAAVALLKDQKAKLIGKYWGTYGENITDFEQGVSEIGTTWPYQVGALQAEDPPIPVDAVLPSEGATGWADTWMLTKDAKHPNCMLMWMDWMSQPGTQQQVAEYFGEAPANLAACPLMDANPGEYGYKGFCDFNHASDDAYAANIKFWKTPLADCGDSRGTTCVDFSAWVSAWTEILAVPSAH